MDYLPTKDLLMRVALVAFENELSWGLRNIAEFLRSKGFNISLYFLERYSNIAHKIPEATMDSFVEDFNPTDRDIVGISFTTPYFHDAKRLADKVHKKGAIVVVGGIHPTILPTDCIPFADYIIRGAGEDAMLILLELLNNGQVPNKGVFQENDKFWFSEDVTKFPYPRYGHVEDTVIVNGKLERTVEVPRRRGPFIRYQTFTSFGCPYNCTYCVNPLLQKLSGRYGRKFVRRRNLSEVMAELRHVQERIDLVSFEDEDFLTDLNWLNPFLKSYKREIGLPFGCLATLATFKGMDLGELVKNLKEAKCVSITIGIQSASPRTAKLFRRYFDRDLLSAVAQAFVKNGIIVTYDIIMENPFEDESDISETVDTILSLPHPFAVNIFYLTFFTKYLITTEAKNRGIKQFSDGDTRVSGVNGGIENWVIQVAQVSFLPRSLLRFFYKNKFAKRLISDVPLPGHILTFASQIRWLVRVILSHPEIVLRPIKRQLKQGRLNIINSD
jgi:radical SAM superfamily enzyme YgiQ (UPF0313 family)